VSKLSVLLVSTNGETFPSPVYSLGLAHLAGALERAGHAAGQFDVLVHGLDALPRVLGETQPQLLALSIRNVDNTDGGEPRSYVGGDRRVLAAIRRHSSAPVVLGGSGFSLFPKQFMELLDADFGIIGPGESALCALAAALADGREPVGIPNTITRNGALPSVVETCAAFVRPKHEADLVAHYWREGGMIGLQTKRGCPKACLYCTYPLIGGATVHHVDPDEAAGEAERLFRDHGVGYLFIVDPVFNADAEREMAFADALRRCDIPVRWGAFFSPSDARRDYWEGLKQSGLTHVEFGTDSLCDAVLASYGRGFTVADAFATAGLCHDLGLFCAHYLIFGGPGETPDTIRETVAAAERLPRCVLFPFTGMRIYPNTALEARARRDGRLDDDDDCFEPRFYFADGLRPDGISRLMAQHATGSQEWVLPSRYPQLAPMMRNLREHGRKGPLWELLLR